MSFFCVCVCLCVCVCVCGGGRGMCVCVRVCVSVCVTTVFPPISATSVSWWPFFSSNILLALSAGQLTRQSGFCDLTRRSALHCQLKQQHGRRKLFIRYRWFGFDVVFLLQLVPFVLSEHAPFLILKACSESTSLSICCRLKLYFFLVFYFVGQTLRLIFGLFCVEYCLWRSYWLRLSWWLAAWNLLCRIEPDKC